LPDWATYRQLGNFCKLPVAKTWAQVTMGEGAFWATSSMAYCRLGTSLADMHLGYFSAVVGDFSTKISGNPWY